MSSIVDVVHKFTYDANTNPLEQVNKVLSVQTEELNSLLKLNAALIAQEKRLAEQGITNRKAINAQIDLNKQKISALTTEMGKQYAQNEKLQQSVKRTAGQFNSLSFSLGNILRDLPYGFIGIANNIGPAFDDLDRKFKQLKAEGKGTGALFSEIGTALFGFTGLVNLAVLGIQFLSGEMGGLTAETADLTKAQEANIVVNKVAAGIYAEQAAKLSVLSEEVANQATTQERLHEIRDEIIKQAPALAKSLEGEENLSIRLYNAISNLTEAYKLQAIIKGAQSLLAKATEKYLAGEVDRADAFGAAIKASFLNSFSGTADALADFGKDLADRSEKQYQQTFQRLFKIIQNAQSQLTTTGLDKITDKDKKIKETGLTLEELRKRIDELARAINRIDASEFEKFAKDLETQAKGAIKELGALADSFTKLEQAQFGSKLSPDQSRALNTQLEVQSDTNKAIGKSKQRINEEKQAQIEADRERARVRMQLAREEYLNQKRINPTGYDTTQAKAKYRESRQQFKELNYDAQTNTRETVKASLEAAQTILANVTDIFNQIYEKQIETIDRQISASQQRISAAVEIAKLGNAEILKAEEDRLETLQKKREEIAEKQLKTNAILRASSAAIATAQAIQTVTNAGATGDPYTTAARIAAAIAALSAGIAFVTSLSEAFAEGVVDYKGKGTGTSDSNIVRISRGESVITAKATQDFKPILEAMNAGTFNPYNLQAMPNQYASRWEMKGVEKKLDSLIDIMSTTGTTVNARMDEHGLNVMTQTIRRRDSNRFRG